MTNANGGSLRSFHIYRHFDGRRASMVLYEEEGAVQYDSILRKLSSALLPFISYNTMKDVPF